MFTLPSYVTDLMQSFKDKGYQIYIVGGPVRNMLLNLPIDNWDFTTNATPEQMLEMFPDAFYHNTYGTVTVPLRIDGIEDPIICEITPFRKESDYLDGRHPSIVTWAATLEEDVTRRDFTINAMAYDGHEIIDFYNGKEHLKQGLIVAVGDPNNRFQEDALRLLRAIRFASQFGFLIEENTREAIKTNAHLIIDISWERIRDEFYKILASAHPAEGILFLRNTTLLKYILPELDDCFAIPQKSPKRHHIYDVGTHLVMSLKNCPSTDKITRFATLIHDIGKAKTFHKDEKTGLITFFNHETVGAGQAKEIVKRFRMSNKDARKVVLLVRHHQFTVSEEITDKAVKRFIKDIGVDLVDAMLDLRTGDRIGGGASATSWRTELFKKRIIEVQKVIFTIADLKVDGHDVMEMYGIPPGRKIGEVLKILFDEVENNGLPNEREPLLKRMQELKDSEK